MAELGAKIKVGTRFEVTGTFTPLDDVSAQDPDAVQLVLLKPDGSSATYEFGTDAEVSKVSPGIYSFRHVPDQVGTYWCVWRATSPLAGISAVEQVAVKVEGTVIDA